MKQLERLKELQTILTNIYKIENEISNIPKKILEDKDILKSTKKDQDNYLREKNELEKKIRQNDLKIHDIMIKKEKRESQSSSVSSQKEYESLLKEIKYLDEDDYRIRRDLDRDKISLENINNQLVKNAEFIEIQEKELEIKEAAIEKEIILKEDSLDELRIKEKILSKGIDEDTLFKFERIIKNKGDSAISYLHSRACSKCNMMVSIKFYNEIKENTETDKISFCQYCSRMIFYSDDKTNEEFEDIELDEENTFQEEEIDNDLLLEDNDNEFDNFDEDDYIEKEEEDNDEDEFIEDDYYEDDYEDDY